MTEPRRFLFDWRWFLLGVGVALAVVITSHALIGSSARTADLLGGRVGRSASRGPSARRTACAERPYFAASHRAMLAVSHPHGEERTMMDWTDSGWSWWWMLPMMVFMLAVIGTILWAVVTVSRESGPSSGTDHPSPDDILNTRFARGEIDSAEYRERVDELHRTSAGRRT
jgi:putative membrane protein